MAVVESIPMKVTLIKFHPRHHEGEEWHIGESGTGVDCTLCGLAHEGVCDNKFLGPDEPKDHFKKGGLKQVTCQSCRGIVELCKSIT